MIKIAGVVVLYNPDESVYQNIKTYIHALHTLYIIDNSSLKHDIGTKLLEYKNIQMIHSGENIGISKALNFALNYAEMQDYKWLMTLDQDTSFNVGDIDIFLESFHILNDENIALVSPLHNKKFIVENAENSFIDKDYIMTSANVVNIKIAREIGGYDENLFIDEVDHEFCFRLKNSEYTIFQYIAIAVNHSLGTSYKYNEKIKLYDPVRLYYMSRNYLYLKNKYYFKYHSFFKIRDRYLLKFFLNQLIYGKQRFKNITMIFKGIKDYKNQKYGKLIDE